MNVLHTQFEAAKNKLLSETWIQGALLDIAWALKPKREFWLSLIRHNGYDTEFVQFIDDVTSRDYMHALACMCRYLKHNPRARQYLAKYLRSLKRQQGTKRHRDSRPR